MLAKLTGVPGTVAHNLMTALIFALGAIGSYGILYNLLALRWKSETGNKESDDLQIASVASQIPKHVSRLSFLAPLFLLIISVITSYSIHYTKLYDTPLGSVTGAAQANPWQM